jgi:hypothetical protein
VAYLPDLTAYDDLGKALSIGWLDGEHPVPTGVTSPEFRKALSEICKKIQSWPPPYMGYHTCEICGQSDGCYIFNVVNEHTGRTYVAPELIDHYVADHNYLPPAEFIEAVIQSKDLSPGRLWGS